MTGCERVHKLFGIIPYQELLGNYDERCVRPLSIFIIPYQELLGNYDASTFICTVARIIPYQELLGNYDWGGRGTGKTYGLYHTKSY